MNNEGLYRFPASAIRQNNGGGICQFLNIQFLKSQFNMLQSEASGLDELRKYIQAMEISSNDELREKVRTVVRDELSALREKGKSAAMRAGAGSASGGVLRCSYSQRLGGSVHILGGNKKYSNDSRSYTPGTQRRVSQRTMQINRYSGADRAFILRFLNSGTKPREVERPSASGRGSRSSWGRRGSIQGRNFFAQLESAATSAGEQASKKIEAIIAGGEQQNTND